MSDIIQDLITVDNSLENMYTSGYRLGLEHALQAITDGLEGENLISLIKSLRDK